MRYDDCPGCGVTDYGWEMPDERARIVWDLVGWDPETGEYEEAVFATITIRRIWDRTCNYCDGADWRPEWELKLPGMGTYRLPSQDAAWLVLDNERKRLGFSPKKLEAIRQYEEDEADYRALCEMERRMGC
jgi:hypothetical protein